MLVSLNLGLFLLLFQIVSSVEFAYKPKDVRQFEDKIATLKCHVEELRVGDTLAWWKDNIKIIEGERIIMADPRISITLEELGNTNIYTYSIAIGNVKINDEGYYYCEVTTESKTITSDRAHLTVLQIPSPKYPECIQSEQSYIVGSEVMLSCISQKLSPPVELIWFHKRMTVPSSKLRTEINDELVNTHYTFIANKNDNDATFRCEQLTEDSEIHNCTIQNLNIQYRPEVKIQHTNALFAGSDSILFCQSFANPPVTQFRWTFTPVLNANEYITDGQVLTLIKPSLSRNGTVITCSAENNIGMSSDTMTLYVMKERKYEIIQANNNDVEHLPETKRNNMNIDKDNQSVSLYVVIIIIVLVVIIVVVVVIIPVYYQCFCKTRTTTDSSGREIYQPTVYYDTRDRASNSGLYDRSLPRLPSTGHYGHWRHSFASQVPGDLDQPGYMYIKEDNEQNTL